MERVKNGTADAVDIDAPDDAVANTEASTAALDGPPIGSTGSGRLWGYGPVLIVLASLVGIVAVIGQFSPTVRDELRTSFTRIDDQYVELYAPTDSVSVDRSRVAIDFGVTSHLAGTQEIPYTVTLIDKNGGVVASTEGALTLANKAKTTVDAVLVAPSGASWNAITVQLDGRPEYLKLLRADVKGMP